jgi:predicted transcriptional regulator of viral defense system
MTPEAFLATHALFTREQLARVLKDRGSHSPGTVSSHLARWRRQSRILKVKEGLYARLDPDADTPAQGIDFLALASLLAPDGALAYHTALEAHGVAQSMFERLTFVTWTKIGRLRFQGREFVPVRPRAALRSSRKARAWIESMDRSAVEVRVTSLERTVADVFDRPDLAGGADEVWRSSAGVPALDLGELESYVRALGSRTLAAKVGFFLERRAEDLAVPPTLLQRLRKQAPRSPVYFDRRRKSRFAPKWNLMVPEDWITVAESEPT